MSKSNAAQKRRLTVQDHIRAKREKEAEQVVVGARIDAFLKTWGNHAEALS
ncbi:MAG: hypothetical protein Q8L80_08010 [Gallionella sp.]|nr:hypothetical protein [Gallionella sp.]MDP1941245.1 hypothetical protein [Gallionella sp.]